VRRLYAIDPLFETAKHGGPSVTRRRSNVRMVRLQQIPFAARFRDCTDGRGRPTAAATKARFIRMTSSVPSTFRVPRNTNKRTRRNSIVIADRNPVFLCGLASMLQAEDDFVVLASCQDEVECIAAIHTLSPSLAPLNMSLSELSGLQVVAIVRTEAFPTLPDIIRHRRGERVFHGCRWRPSPRTARRSREYCGCSGFSRSSRSAAGRRQPVWAVCAYGIPCGRRIRSCLTARLCNIRCGRTNS
jgi:hypothetical protein